MTKTTLYTNIPTNVWITINKRVAIILASSMGGEYYKPLRVLPNYQQLVMLCERWKTTTFNDLVAFARQLAATADKNAHLIRTICPAGAWQVKQANIPQLNSLIDQVSAELRGLSQTSQALQQHLDAFENAQFQADVAHGQNALNPEWEVFTLAGGNAITLARSRWDTAVQQITYLKSQLPIIEKPLLAEQQSSTSAQRLTAGVQLAADLQEALKDWQEIANLARSFETAVPTLRRYLDSDEWTYQQPAIDPHHIYQINSRLTGQTGILDYDPQTLGAFGLTLGPSRGNVKTHYWSFQRMGNGWYQIQNMWGNALTYGENPYLAPANGTHVQYWRFVAAGDGWYRLVNLTAPHQHVLGVFKANTTHQIINHHEKKFLFIPISESISTVEWIDHRLEAMTMSASDGDLAQQWQVTNGISRDTSFAEQGYLISQCTSGNSSWAVTLDGTSVVVKPLRNTIWQKWTAVYERVIVEGIQITGVAYVCEGMGVVSGGVNAPLTVQRYQPGQIRFLWMTRTMQFGNNVFMNIMHPLVGTGQVWDIFGGCPSAYSSRIGLYGENGGDNQRWFALMV